MGRKEQLDQELALPYRGESSQQPVGVEGEEVEAHRDCTASAWRRQDLILDFLP